RRRPARVRGRQSRPPRRRLRLVRRRPLRRRLEHRPLSLGRPGPRRPRTPPPHAPPPRPPPTRATPPPAPFTPRPSPPPPPTHRPPAPPAAPPMPPTRPTTHADVTFLPPAQGGRQRLPAPTSRQYVPHVVVRSEKYLGVRFVDGPSPLESGKPARVTLELMY